ncbi:vitamin B12 dependent-methionine synthase activation domain-containing protein, partial [candidate division KSB1 bacterium]
RVHTLASVNLIEIGNRYFRDQTCRFFDENDFAIAAMLDSVASLAADKAVELCESYYLEYLVKNGLEHTDTSVLSYSPGYCGWHLSAQGKLFRFLRPERIGITLNDSYLMTPLKSVTGLLAAGDREIHLFECNFSFCGECKTFSCRERMESLLSLK